VSYLFAFIDESRDVGTYTKVSFSTLRLVQTEYKGRGAMVHLRKLLFHQLRALTQLSLVGCLSEKREDMASMTDQ